MIFKRIIKYRNETGLRVLKNKYVLMTDRKIKFKMTDADIAFYSRKGRCLVNLRGKMYVKYKNTEKETCEI